MEAWQMQIRLHKAVWRESYLWHLLFPDPNLDEQILEWRIGAVPVSTNKGTSFCRMVCAPLFE